MTTSENILNEQILQDRISAIREDWSEELSDEDDALLEWISTRAMQLFPDTDVGQMDVARIINDRPSLRSEADLKTLETIDLLFDA